MDYERMWNELKTSLEHDEGSPDISAEERFGIRDTLKLMSTISTKHTTLYIRETLNSTEK